MIVVYLSDSDVHVHEKDTTGDGTEHEEEVEVILREGVTEELNNETMTQINNEHKKTMITIISGLK